MQRNPKVLIIIGIVLAVAAILLSTRMTVVSSFLSRYRKPRSSEMSFAVARCSMLRNLLEEYYAQVQPGTHRRDAEGFVDFMMNLEDWQEFTREAPPEGYKGFKVGFSFFLPDELENNMPAFIAYTTPVTDGSGKVHRLTLLLRGSKIETMSLDKWIVEGIFGAEECKRVEADLWAWRKGRRANKNNPLTKR